MKYIISICLLAWCQLSSLNTNGQTPTFAWAKAGVTGGTDGYSDQEYLTTDNSGNTYVSGTFYNAYVTFGTDTLYNSSYNYWSLFVMKYNPRGNVIWAVQPKGLFYSSGRAITINNATGKLYIAASFQDNYSYPPGYIAGTFGPDTFRNVSGPFIAELDAGTGNVDWVKEMDSHINVNCIAVNGDSIVIGGTFKNTVYTGNYPNPYTSTPVPFGSGITLTNESNYGLYDLFFAECDHNGNTIWAQQAYQPAGGSSEGISMQRITTDHAGNILMIGNYQGSLVIGTDSLVSAGIWIYTAKFDYSGNFIWAVSNGSVPVSPGTGYNSGTKVVCDEDNNVIITGVYFYILTWGNDTLNNNPNSYSQNYHTFVVKYDPSGNVLWAIDPRAEFNTSYGGPSVATDKQNNVYLIMTYEKPFVFDTFSLSPIVGQYNESRDVFIAKMNPNGHPLWLKSVGGTLDEYGSDITTDTSSNVYITGSFASTDIHFDTITLSSPAAGLSIFTAKIGPSINPDIVQFTVNDSVICQNSSITFSDQSPGSPTGWAWIFTGGTPDTSSLKNPTITYNDTGIYNVQLIATFASGTVNLTKTGYILVKPRPVAGILSSIDDSICAGATAYLRSNSISTGNVQWQSSLTASDFIDINGTDTSVYSNALDQSAYFRVVISNGSCADTSAPFLQVVNRLPQPPVLSTPDSFICSSDSALINTSGSYSSYKWNNGGTRPYIYASSAGGYWVTVTDVNGRSAASSHQNITVYPVPSVSIVEQGDTLSSFGSNSYQWYLNDSIIPGADKAVYVAHQTGNYAVQITDSNGCKALSTNQYLVINGIPLIDENNSLSVYPNPFTNIVFIKVTNTALQLKSIALNNCLGEQVMIKKPTNPSVGLITLDVSALPAGVYLLKLTSPGTVYTKQVVKL